LDARTPSDVVHRWIKAYTVVGTATVWMYAPDNATRIVWDTGECDFLQQRCTDIPIAFAEAAAA
jgi:hypothetical protein